MQLDDEIRRYLAYRYECDPNEDVDTDGDAVYVNATMPGTNERDRFYVGDLADVQHDLDLEEWYLVEHACVVPWQ